MSIVRKEVLSSAKLMIRVHTEPSAKENEDLFIDYS